MPPAEPEASSGRRKPRPRPAPYKQKPKTATTVVGLTKDLPSSVTSVKQLNASQCEHLTLHEWLMVFAYIDKHPDLPQDQIIEYFKTRAEGSLEFTQSTLSQKLKD